MQSVKSIVEHHLRTMGRLSEIKLGEQPGEKEGDVTARMESDCRVLVGELRGNRSTINQWILGIYIAFSCLAVLWLFFLAAAFVDDALIKGGVFAALVAVIERLRQLWIQKTLIDAVLAIVEGLPPSEGIKAVESFYWNTFRGKP